MGTRAPHVGFGLATLVTLALAVPLGLVASGAPAAASTSARSSSAAPSVALRQTGTNVVTVSGRTASASPKVRFHRYAGSRWVFVKRVRAHHHRYSTTLSVAAGTTARYRVTSNHRSRTFTVRMAAAKLPTLYDDCGARPRKADGTAWSCTFHDDFGGTTLDRTKWAPQVTATSGFLTGDATAGYACYVDDPDNVSVGSGMLSLTVRKESAVQLCGSPYTAGSVSTYHLFTQQYGRFEARIRTTATSAPGLQETFWLWPDDQTTTIDRTNSGEIDVSETYSLHPNLSIPFLHYAAQSTPVPGVNTAWNCTAYRGRWTTYTLQWGPTSLAIYVNGKLCLTNTALDPVFRTRHIIALTQALGMGANAITSGTPIPARLDIDYVRAWQ